MSRTLWDALCGIEDRRGRKGRQYKLPSLLGISIAAMLAGANDLIAIFRWGRRLKPEAAGFGVMFAGSAGAATVARVFFVRPARWLAQQTRVACVALLVTTWTLLARFILRPLFAEIAFWVRVLFRGRAR